MTSRMDASVLSFILREGTMAVPTLGWPANASPCALEPAPTPTASPALPAQRPRCFADPECSRHDAPHVAAQGRCGCREVALLWGGLAGALSGALPGGWPGAWPTEWPGPLVGAGAPREPSARQARPLRPLWLLPLLSPHHCRLSCCTGAQAWMMPSQICLKDSSCSRSDRTHDTTGRGCGSPLASLACIMKRRESIHLPISAAASPKSRTSASASRASSSVSSSGAQPASDQPG
mmetsp:Transcript_19513/g.63571  ORF Transcript_19513/g.63571 Transcript_19513/m.63571 type:complete len:235 (+) Transcript_19513:1339-2043(+)